MNLATVMRTARTMLERGRSATAIGNYLDGIAELTPGTFPDPDVHAAWESVRTRAIALLGPDVTPGEAHLLALELTEFDPRILDARELAFVSAVRFAADVEVARSEEGWTDGN